MPHGWDGQPDPIPSNEADDDDEDGLDREDGSRTEEIILAVRRGAPQAARWRRRAAIVS
jgi:hypothetical protein